MPRPRVPPSQRRRTAEACSSCREVKKRCSGSAPCSHCLRRGIGGQCTMPSRPGASPAPDRGPSRRRPGPAESSTASAPIFGTSVERPAAAGRECEGGGVRPPPPCAAPASPESPGGCGPPHRLDDGSSLSTESHPRMLLNLRGQRGKCAMHLGAVGPAPSVRHLYIGGAASLSFLQVVRGVVAAQIGPSQFSHNAQSDTMLETESSRSTPSSLVHLDVAMKLAYAQSYHAVTEGFIDVFEASEIEAAFIHVDDTTMACPSPQRQAVLGLVIAIGAQVKSLETARDVGQHYFRQAQHHAFDGMLEDPDIDIVRSFLLMAFYLFGECRRNAAFMYLGVATRAAVALGLHSRESYADMNDPKEDLRLRVWISLRIVDMLANAILGRPAATAGLPSDINGIVHQVSRATQDDDVKRLIASHQIVCIICGVVDTLYEKKELSIPVVERLLSDIQSWVNRLPDCVRSASINDESAEPVAHRGAIGSIHVSCLYYFAVTLATRPFLISTLTAPPASGGLAQSHLSSACLDAAVLLVQTCVDARKANLLYGNMCIMKALVFSAGLALGFEIFAKRPIDYEIESAFRGARDVLNFLATQSPQAAHYYEILTLLANAITRQRQETMAKSKSRYVSKIFTLSRTAECDAEGERDWLPTSSRDCAPASEEQGAGWLSENGTPADPEREASLGWDCLDISQWDSFPSVS